MKNCDSIESIWNTVPAFGSPLQMDKVLKDKIVKLESYILELEIENEKLKSKIY